MTYRSWALIAVAVAAGCGGDQDHPADATVVVDAPPAVTCVPATCEIPTLACGTLDDGCGHPLVCSCPEGTTCGANAAANVCGIAVADRWCNTAGYCWEYPLPFGTTLNATFGAVTTDVWAGGGGMQLLRWNGATWSKQATTSQDPTGAVQTIWGTAANDVWIGGDLYLRHWNGSALTTTDAIAANFSAGSIRGQATNDIWVGGDFGTADTYHWNGSTWQPYADVEFFGVSSIWPFSPALVWGFGFSDTAEAWTSSSGTWAELPSSTPMDVHAQWGTSPTDHWLGGDGLVHYDGTSFTPELGVGDDIFALDGTAATDIWAGGRDGLYHFDGSAWTHDATTSGRSILGLSLTGGMAVGDRGYSATFDGAAWHQHTGFGAPIDAERAFGFGDHDFVVVGHGLASWRDGTTTITPAPSSTAHHMSVVAPGDAWALEGADGIAHWDGAHWTHVAITIAGVPFPQAIWANDHAVYVATAPADSFHPSPVSILRYDGSTWQVVHSVTWNPSDQFASHPAFITGSGESDIWVVSERAEYAHWDGVAWTDGAIADTGGASIGDLWRSPSGTWFATAAGHLYKQTATAWSVVDGNSGYEPLTFLSGTSETDLWASLGYTDQIARWNGTTWSVEDTSAGGEIVGLSVTPTTILVATRTGGILRKTR